MPKLTTSSHTTPPDDQKRDKQAPAEETRCRPCPRCYVPLVLERQYRSRGLSGSETMHETYVCPACDARFQHNPADGRLRELS
jgi:DNA-directed RNA polymerase subunit M/transcription elongation factor TFIIS